MVLLFSATAGADELQPKMTDPSIDIIVTNNLGVKVGEILDEKKDKNAAILFNYRLTHKSYHTGLLYLQVKGGRCDAIFIDSTNGEDYRETMKAYSRFGEVRDCKNHFIYSPRQADSYSCSTFCVHDLLSIQKTQGRFVDYFQDLEKLGVSQDESGCVPSSYLHPSLLKLSHSVKSAVSYLDQMDSRFAEIPSVSAESRESLQNSIMKNHVVLQESRLPVEDWKKVQTLYPNLTEIYYGTRSRLAEIVLGKRAREVNLKPNKKYLQYNRLILKKLLSMDDVERQKLLGNPDLED